MTGNEKRGGRAAEGVGMEGWGRKVKVVGRSDGDLMGGRKDGVRERRGQEGLRQESEGGRSEDEVGEEWIFLGLIVLARDISLTCSDYQWGGLQCFKTS